MLPLPDGTKVTCTLTPVSVASTSPAAGDDRKARGESIATVTLGDDVGLLPPSSVQPVPTETVNVRPAVSDARSAASKWNRYVLPLDGVSTVEATNAAPVDGVMVTRPAVMPLIVRPLTGTKVTSTVRRDACATLTVVPSPGAAIVACGRCTASVSDGVVPTLPAPSVQAPTSTVRVPVPNAA